MWGRGKTHEQRGSEGVHDETEKEDVRDDMLYNTMTKRGGRGGERHEEEGEAWQARCKSQPMRSSTITPEAQRGTEWRR